MDYAFEEGAVLSTQGSAEWMESRLGKLTASKIGTALGRLKTGPNKGQMNQAARDLMMDLVAERMTRQPAMHYVTPAMQWGTDHEPVAKTRYTELTGRAITPCGYFDHPEIDMCGASPDGLLGDDGLVEIKCPTSTTHIAWMMQETCPEDYQPQMLLQLACTGRRWCDFVSFDPRMPEPQRVLIWRFAPAREQLVGIEQAARLFLAETDALFRRLSAPRTIIWPPRLAA